jgi:hypothetical protein
MADVRAKAGPEAAVLVCERCHSHMHLKATGRTPTVHGSRNSRVRMYFVCPAAVRNRKSSARRERAGIAAIADGLFR